MLQVNTDGRQVSGLNQNTVKRYSITTSFELFSHLVIIMHLLWRLKLERSLVLWRLKLKWSRIYGDVWKKSFFKNFFRTWNVPVMPTYIYLCFCYVSNKSEFNIYFEYFRCSLHHNFQLFCLLHLKGVESLTKEIEVKFLICRSLRAFIDPQCLWFW